MQGESTPSISCRALVLAVSAGIGVCLVPLLVPLLTGRVFVRGDLSGTHLPMRYLFSEALKAGDSPLWTPAMFGGFYVHGEGQVGMFHPLHWLLYRYLGLQAAFNLEIVATYVFGLTGAVRLLRRVTALPWHAALVGGLLFAFSGFHLIVLEHVNAIAIVAHLPWMLLAVHTLLTCTRPAARTMAFAGLALLIASQICIGYPQYFLIVGLTTAAWTLWQTAAARAWAKVPWVIAAAVCGVAIGGVQLVPTSDVLATSVRSTLPFGRRVSFSMHPWNLVQLWAPHAIAARGLAYDGVFCTLALVWAWCRRRERRLPSARAAAVTAGCAVVLALGRYGGVYPLLARWPVFSLFRAPQRFVVIAHAAFALIGAGMFADLADLVRRRQPVPWRPLLPLLVPLALAVLTAVLGPVSGWSLGGEVTWADGPHRIASVLLVATLTLVVLAAARARRWAIVVLPVLVAADLSFWGYRYLWAAPPSTIDAITAALDDPPAPQPGERVAILTDDVNVYVMKGYRVTTGYAGLPPARLLDPAMDVPLRLAGAAAIRRAAVWRRVPDPMPRARCISDVRVSHDVAADVNAIDIAATALVGAPLEVDPAAPRRVAIVSDRPGHIELGLDAGGRCLAVLSEAYHAGWRAVDDRGQPLPAVAAYHDFLAVLAGPETRRVILTFAPPSFRRGYVLTLAGLLTGVVAAAVLGRIRIRG